MQFSIRNTQGKFSYFQERKIRSNIYDKIEQGIGVQFLLEKYLCSILKKRWPNVFIFYGISDSHEVKLRVMTHFANFTDEDNSNCLTSYFFTSYAKKKERCAYLFKTPIILFFLRKIGLFSFRVWDGITTWFKQDKEKRKLKRMLFCEGAVTLVKTTRF